MNVFLPVSRSVSKGLRIAVGARRGFTLARHTAVRGGFWPASDRWRTNAFKYNMDQRL